MENHYRQGQWREIVGLIERTRPAVEKHGTPTLRAYYYDSLMSAHKRQHRYVADDELLQYARAMHAAGQDSGDARLAADAEFELGFALLLRGDFAEAAVRLHSAEAINRRIGSAIFLTYVLEALAATRANHIGVHEAVAEGNLAWLSLRHGSPDEAGRHGQAAVALWQASTFAYPLQWTAYLPMLAAALHHGRLAAAVSYARALQDEGQQRLPDEVDGPLAKAVAHFEAGDETAAGAFLQRAVEAAERLNFV